MLLGASWGFYLLLKSLSLILIINTKDNVTHIIMRVVTKILCTYIAV